MEGGREAFEFFAAGLLGMLIPLGCVWVSHYVMGFTSLLADNIANNVVGLALGTASRFVLYRWWVFSPRRAARRALIAADAAPAAPTDTATGTVTIPVD